MVNGGRFRPFGHYGVYNLTKFGVNGFTESLRQEVTRRHVRVGVLQPGGVDTELGSHNKPDVRGEMIDPFYEQTEVLAPEDIADGVAYMVTRPRHASRAELADLIRVDSRHMATGYFDDVLRAPAYWAKGWASTAMSSSSRVGGFAPGR